MSVLSNWFIDPWDTGSVQLYIFVGSLRELSKVRRSRTGAGGGDFSMCSEVRTKERLRMQS